MNQNNTPAVGNRIFSIQDLQSDTLPQLLNPNFYLAVEQRIEEAEKANKPKYHFLNDVEVLYYWVHEQKILSDEKNRKSNTKEVYTKEILLFAEQLIANAQQFELDGAEIVANESLWRSLRTWHLRRYGRWLKTAPLGRGGNPYAAATLAKKTTIIRSFLQHLYSSEYIEHNCYTALLRESITDDDRPDRDVSESEVKQILDWLKQSQNLFGYTIILFLVTTGLRIAELCNSTMSDFYRVDNQIWLRVKGKRDKKRDVFISDTLWQAITAFRHIRSQKTELYPAENSPTFVNARHAVYSPSWLSHKVSTLMQSCPLPFVQHRPNPITAHNFRHAFAIISHSNGADVYNIQQTLGHESIHTTSKIYLAKHQKRVDNAALVFAKDLS
ncbi:MAG: tyrosine-type recombinase/integrase [Bacilli bacterium]